MSVMMSAKGRRHGGGNVDHAEAFLFDADFLEHVAGVIDPAFGAEVAFHEMAAAFETAGHQHAVRAFSRAFMKYSVSSRPVQGVRMMRTLGGYWMRMTPARSADE